MTANEDKFAWAVGAESSSPVFSFLYQNKALSALVQYCSLTVRAINEVSTSLFPACVTLSGEPTKSTDCIVCKCGTVNQMHLCVWNSLSGRLCASLSPSFHSL